MAQLGELVEQVRGSGLPTELTVLGTPPALPDGAQLTIYRIVQEALTNSLKHGGPGTRASVEITFADGEIRLRATDDGRGGSPFRIRGGHGLVGMRERAALYGGEVVAGPGAGGGFQVLVRLPIGEEPRP
jgi:signal transduction histidine kinase